MKNITLAITGLIFCFSLKAQYNCSGNRYVDSLFTVSVTQNVLYGNNKLYTGVYTDLFMDIYTPDNDTATARPLIIFAPKGSFLQCDKAEWTMQQLCRHFAARGYVTASINYRVGVDYVQALTNPQGEFFKAVMRAFHDYKAAIRFFRKDAATTNTYKIDPNMIIAGGSSAGAITALHVAYLDQVSEIPAQIDTTGLGGIEGLTGNAGYSSSVNYVVNLCGAIADTSWIQAGNVPLISMHGNLDTEVPYGTAVVTMIVPITEVDGSASIKPRADHLGIENPFYTFWGKTHIPYDPNAGGSYLMYMDTVLNYVRTNLYNWICTASGVNENNLAESVKIYPNPATDRVTVEFPSPLQNSSEIVLSDLSGKTILSGKANKGASEITLFTDKIKPGMYLLCTGTQVTKLEIR